MSAQSVLNAAIADVGYLEKASNAYLDDKTANAGYNNYTKFGKWYGLNPAEWCDMAVSYWGNAGGESAAVGKFAYCPSHVSWFKSRGQWKSAGVTPQPGYIIFFRDSYDPNDAGHVGIVEYVSGGYVHTIEGNTSSSAGVVPNGGGAFRKSYSVSSGYILGYGCPAYSGANTTTTTTAATTATSTASANKTTYANIKSKVSSFTYAKEWKNGSTPETVYGDAHKSIKIGELDPYDSAICLGKFCGLYVIAYNVENSANCKVGLVEYAGGCVVANAVGKNWANGSTDEYVYSDTNLIMNLGSLDPRETCPCFGKVNGRYIVAYSVDGTTNSKLGLVEYNGGL